MKTVAVLIPTFTIEYDLDLLSGISDSFTNNDFQVIIAQTKIPHLNQGAFDYQYCTSIEYLKSHDIDAIIVASGVYCSSMNQSAFTELISEFGNRPVISIGTNLKLKNSYTIVADCNKSFNQVIEHLKNEHGCKKIAFFSANSTKSEEAFQRYDAFTSALASNNLPFYPNFVYDGIFTDFKAYEEIKKRFKTKDDIPFDAIVCANDMMASGCLKAFYEIGVRVPEDVKIVGFDDSLVASISVPRLSTINQDVYRQGFEAAEIVKRLLNGKKQKKDTLSSLLPKFRQSCGCIDCKNSQRIYKSAEGEISIEKENFVNITNELNEKNNIITLMDTVRGANTLKQMFYNLRFITDQCDFSAIAINFFNDIVFLDYEETFILPNDVELSMLIDRDSNIELFKPDVKFNPHEKIVASRSLQDKSGIFILNPIFSGETNYGFILCKIKGKKFADYNVYLKIIITAISQAYEYTSKIKETQKLETENTDLYIQSKTDELTGIYNRRGFIEKGQNTLDMLQETDTVGIICFLDMDGLKKINDTYGHEMGDKAIKAQAKVLKSVFSSSDVIGRLSGDEFGIVAVGVKLSHFENYRLKINMMNKKVSKEEELPFCLSSSVGVVDLQSSSSLKKLLTEADKELYKEKRKKHGTIS